MVTVPCVCGVSVHRCLMLRRHVALEKEKERLMGKHDCPRCEGAIPTELHKGQYPGALSRTDNETEICSQCGQDEAWEQMAGVLRPRDKWESWLAWRAATAITRDMISVASLKLLASDD